MSSKGLVGLHWLSIVWIIIILILSAVTLYEIVQAHKEDDPTKRLSYAENLSIASVVFISVLLLPLLYWIWKQSKIGFSSEMIDVVF